MLWTKAWLETRSRFLISLIGIASLCSLSLLHWDRNATVYAKLDYYYAGLVSTHSLLTVMWSLAVTLLMMGGLVREHAAGSAGYTLALPVSRSRLMAVRIAMGLAQAAALAIVPWLAMFVVGSVFGETHSVSQAVYFLVLLLAGGLPIFAIAVLASSAITGEYTAPVASFGVVLVMLVVFGNTTLGAYGPTRFMSGADFVDRTTELLRWPIPWVQAGVYILIAMLLIVASVKIVEKRDF